YATRTSQGTKMPRADWKVLRTFPVAVPPKALLNQFRAVFDSALGLMQNLMFRNRALRVTRDLLLPRLISGELDVSDLDIAVPEAAA
ncbi:MAG TPA: restriction endonuclease subunit S, partial [Thermoanaerobaculia bacterium]|nr:restriction endonuclease subunit S [Thermoanaerobaculia bacterium]